MTQTARVPLGVKLAYTAFMAVLVPVYNRRALPAWTRLFVVDMLVCFFPMPPPFPHPGLTPVNINYVWGLRDTAAQTLLPPYIWFAGLLLGIPVFVFAPTHFLLARVMPRAT